MLKVKMTLLGGNIFHFFCFLTLFFNTKYSFRLLYQGIFDPKDKDHQYFPLSSFNGYSRSYRKVKLVILNNYGNKDFTCLYRFRVHDK